jgi:hypothetical protein
VPRRGRRKRASSNDGVHQSDMAFHGSLGCIWSAIDDEAAPTGDAAAGGAGLRTAVTVIHERLLKWERFKAANGPATAAT